MVGSSQGLSGQVACASGGAWWCGLCVLMLVWGCEGSGDEPRDSNKTWALSGGRLIFQDDFHTGALASSSWNNTAPEGGWVVKDGELFSAGTRNKALWLKEKLPGKVRVEFDARSESEDGDIKVEVFGDGERHESGYILIFGGWKNSLNTIARMDEHGKDRQVGSPGVKVEKGKVYKMAVVRVDNRVQWYLDRDEKTLLMEFDDKAPLRGRGHSHFGFNNWSVPLHFDNVKVFDLTQ